MSFIIGVLQSLVASFICALFKTKRSKKSKSAFDARSKLFHTKISPYLLNTVIPKLSPEIHKKLYRVNSNGETLILPFIELESISKLSISRNLQTAKRKFKIDNKLIKWLTEDLGKKLKNKPTFIVHGISSNCELSIGLGDYYATISTSDIHYLNLIRYFPLKSKLGVFLAYRHGKYVSKWLTSLKSVVLDRNYFHYCASIGCSVFTVLKSLDGEYKYLIKKNSQAKGSSALEYHVIPSFMFQPVARQINEQERELDLTLSVVREFGEELLGLQKLESAETVDSLLGIINSSKLLSCLKNKIDNKRAILEQTGFVLDLYRLRPEITFLLIIHEEDFSRNIKTNWETESLEMIMLNDEDAYNELLLNINKPLCSPALAALVNGRKKALEIIA